MKRFFIAIFLTALLESSGVYADDMSYFNPHRHDRLKIGVMFIASGPMGGYGRHGSQAVELAVDEINAAGGIIGKPVEYLFEDTELNAGKVEEIAERFIHEEKVDFLIGPTSSGLAVTLSEIARENRIPLARYWPR